MAKTITYQVEIDTQGAVKSVKNLNEELDKTDQEMENIDEGTKSATKSMGGLTAATKLLASTLKAVGIGLVLAAVAAVTEFAMMTDEAKEWAIQLKEGSITMINGIIRRTTLSRAELAELAKLTNQEQERNANLALSLLQNQNLAELQRQIRDNEQKDIDTRIAANRRLGAIQKEQLDDELKIAKLGVRQAELSLKNLNNSERRAVLAEAQAELADVEERITGQISEQKTNQVSLDREKVELQRIYIENLRLMGKTEEDMQFERENGMKGYAQLMDAIARPSGEESFWARLEREEDAAERLFKVQQQNFIDISKLYEEDTMQYQEALNQKLAAEMEYSQLLANHEAQRVNMSKQLINNMIDSIESALLQGSDTAKAVAIAQAIWNAYEAINKAWTAPYPYNILLVATTAASTFANIQKILSTNVENAASSGSSAPETPSIGAQVNVTGNADLGNQAANAVSAGMADPMRAYVVSTDVTTQQALDRRIKANALFG